MYLSGLKELEKGKACAKELRACERGGGERGQGGGGNCLHAFPWPTTAHRHPIRDIIRGATNPLSLTVGNFLVSFRSALLPTAVKVAGATLGPACSSDRAVCGRGAHALSGPRLLIYPKRPATIGCYAYRTAPLG